MDDILDVIEQEEKHYRKLIGLSTDKKNAIIKGDIRTLEDITNEEQDVTSILKNLETKDPGFLRIWRMYSDRMPRHLPYAK